MRSIHSQIRDLSPKSRRIFLISLGCAKNLVDSENMLGLLAKAGFDFARDIEEAEVVVINTCGFIQSAVEEAIDAILGAAKLKKDGLLRRLVVTGCLVQRYGRQLGKEIPEVDAWLGTGQIGRIAEAMEAGVSDAFGAFFMSRPHYLADHRVPRFRTTPFYTAFLKIAEGCSHHCSYCMIPRLRGAFRSREPDSLIQEAEEMAVDGVKEINLVAQDVTLYGRDLKRRSSLEELLEHLSALPGIRWIRLLYCHPDRISDRLLDLMEAEEKICPYLDLPLQHSNPQILKAMGRPLGRETPLDLVKRIRSRGRRIFLRTTLMAGFPGETEGMFQELYGFINEARFDRLGVFVFSPEEGTPAYRLNPRVNLRTAEKRRTLMMQRQAEISEALNGSLIGQVVPVLIEGESEETPLLLTGRMEGMAPEVDGQVLINRGNAAVGEIMAVRITNAFAYDVVGEIVA